MRNVRIFKTVILEQGFVIEIHSWPMRQFTNHLQTVLGKTRKEEDCCSLSEEEVDMDNVKLRKATLKDFKRARTWPEYPRWAQFSDFYRMGPADEFQHYINDNTRICYAIVIDSTSKEELVGFLVVSSDKDVASLGIMLHPEWLGTGIGAKVVLRVFLYCFLFLNVERIEVCIDKKNHVSVSMANRLMGLPVSEKPEVFVFSLGRDQYLKNKKSWDALCFS